ncbi:F-box protein At1g55000 [Macadamia integrifolia]|uniref:F-box protein At1g55000 n=1 Tax=Macadamia integrifolia TaxID=60698 RepID=UPI001C4E6A78|nr:F-box protein At1g55000 [Macadamia integrifolia]
MGCCGDDDGIYKQQLIPNPNQHDSSSYCFTQNSMSALRNPSMGTPTNLAGSSASSSSKDVDVISPMNSNFFALTCRDILRSIFERLPVTDLARAACVCRFWNLVASDREIQTRAFISPWKLKDVIGKPSSGSFWRDNSLGRFAISHHILRGDTVASLAVKYSVQVMDIKRLNNMLSDHGIYSRERLLIPLSKPDHLCNRTCYIEFDVYAKREVAVVYLEGGPDGKNSCLMNRSTTTKRGNRRVIDSLKRSMRVDDGTAEYYLSISNGDPRAALAEFSEDLRWEDREIPS